MKQHWVPKCYLKAWIDPCEKRLWVFSKDGSYVRYGIPQTLFRETDMYTIVKPDGTRDQVLEHRLSELETRFVEIRERKFERYLPLDQTEFVWICAFMALMHRRTRVARERFRRAWSPILADLEAMKKWADNATPEQKMRMASPLRPSLDSTTHSYTEVRNWVENPLQYFLPSAVRDLTPVLRKLDWAVFTTDDDIGFITSDHPCIWLDPEIHKRPPLDSSNALTSKAIEITLPISPRQCILLNRVGLVGYFDVQQPIVDRANRKTRYYCGTHFVVGKKEKRAVWFETDA